MVFLSPQSQFLFLRTSDAALTHFRVAAYLRFGEFAVFTEDNVETQTYDTQSDEYEGGNENFHDEKSVRK